MATLTQAAKFCRRKNKKPNFTKSKRLKKCPQRQGIVIISSNC